MYHTRPCHGNVVLHGVLNSICTASYKRVQNGGTDLVASTRYKQDRVDDLCSVKMNRMNY